jgi:gluconate 2-dehydrogenase gamma chain
MSSTNAGPSKGPAAINRRQAIVRLAVVSSGASVMTGQAAGQTAPVAGQESKPVPTGQPGPDREGWPKGSKDPLDPDLVNPELLWPKLLTVEERATAAVVCDVIVPADDRSPAASAVGVHDFIDEWVSAPYPRQKEDRQLVRGGLAWINTEANRRFGKRFAELSAAQRMAICDDIAYVETAKRPFKAGARFFDRMRQLTVMGFFTTVEGMKDLGYVGNMPAAEWKGPSDAVKKRLGLL